jgi:hypothetical protein
MERGAEPFGITVVRLVAVLAVWCWMRERIEPAGRAGDAVVRTPGHGIEVEGADADLDHAANPCAAREVSLQERSGTDRGSIEPNTTCVGVSK